MDKTVQIEAKVGQESVWLTQAQIAKLFRTDRSVISKHLHNIFKTKELQEKSNVQKMHIALSDKPVKFYNLDVIISAHDHFHSRSGNGDPLHVPIFPIPRHAKK
jgi:hypothetical protein